MQNDQTTTELYETIHPTPLPGVFMIERPTFPDERGSFHEDFRLSELEAVVGEPIDICQANVSRNNKAGTLRGIHCAPWGKLVRAVVGTVQVAVVDFNTGSPTFGKVWTEVIGDNGRKASVWVPAGCGNAYMTMEDGVAYAYDVTMEFQPGLEIAVRWDDPDLAVPWKFDELPGVRSKPILSPKDAEAPTLQAVMAEGLLKAL